MSRKHSRQAKAERRAQKAAKNERRQRQRNRDLPPSNALLSGLEEAEEALTAGDLEVGVEILEELSRRYPRRLEVLGMLLEAYFQQQDMWSYQSVCQRLIDLDPDAVDLWLALAGTALGNGQFATAHRAFSHVLDCWPEHADAGKARNVRDDLEPVLCAEAAKYGMQLGDEFELLFLHDEINLHLHLGEYDRVIDVAGRLLSRCPIFAPALNNRSEAQFRSGFLELAIADARRVLEFDAGNFHALGNLTRYLFLGGQFDEAQVVAERLKSAQSDAPDLFVKQAEALAMLGDWNAVLDTLRRAEEQETGKSGGDMGLLYHLAGTAAAELGQCDDARRYWKRASRLGSAAEWAEQILGDLKLQPGEQNGPWAFPIESWIPRSVVDQLVSGMERTGWKASNSVVRGRVRKFLEQRPYIEKLAPVLLERGDAAAKEFIVRVASLAETPAILSALQGFAFGRRGTDKLRHDAAVRLVDAKVIEPGRLRMWVKGEPHDVSLMSIEITPEPMGRLPQDVQALARRGFQALQDGNGAEAESILDEALRRQLDDPSLAYNRAVAIQVLGRKEEAMALVREIHARCPDYLFARVRLAEEAIERRDFETARGLLDPLMSRRRFHQSEYAALCHAHIELFVAQGETEGARMWLKMWEDVAPDDERVMHWHARLNKRGLLGKLFR